VLRVVVRRELVPLWQRAFAIADAIHHYPINSRGPDGQSWGPWAYSNRPIAGTQRASGHSFALSVDVNAPDNPYSLTWRCTIPPGLVADWESLGLYWGGRYVGQKFDPMHFGYCRTPADVPASVARADTILGTTPTPTPPPEDPVTPADVDAIAKAVVKQLMGTAVVPFNDPATPGVPVAVSFGNLLPKLGNWAAVTNDNVNDLAGKA
jgi:hypothetical protein